MPRAAITWRSSAVGPATNCGQRLSSARIGTGIHYPIPCHLQPPFLSRRISALPATEQAAGEILSLPMYPHITNLQVRQVAGAIAEFLAEPHAHLAGVA